jgi:DNA polymerase V
MFCLVDANSFYASCERVFRPDLAGRPIVVLSNNDGCVIARSKEAKTLGIEMGVPYFKAKAALLHHHVAVYSSNYTLYDDMSRRVQDILRHFAQDMEVYSIDESFLHWSIELPWEQTGRQIISTIRQWIGLPVGVGFGRTKTLAKLANKIAKIASGVCVLQDERTEAEALSRINLIDIWGISTRSARRLNKIGITTPLELRRANPHHVRRELGVVGQRIVHELRGDPCIPLEAERPDKQNICCSRSFGVVTSDPSELREAVATFAAQAAMKMRRQNLFTHRVGVFIQTDRHAPVEQYAASWAVTLHAPSDDSRLIINCAAWCLQNIFRGQHAYKKAGVMLFNLCRRPMSQMALFESGDPIRADGLMKMMDDINIRHGRGTIRLASTSPFTLSPCRTWHLRSDHRSPRYTTRWKELPTARARDFGT